MMQSPIEPSREDCCNSGCNPCIFDVYEKQLKLYEEYRHQGDRSITISNYGISQTEYTIFSLIDVESICSTQKILFFKKFDHDQYQKVWWNPGDHFLLKYTSACEVSCTRAYTPIKLHKIHRFYSKDHDFFIVVKKYTNGILSNYLFNLTIGEKTLWRGPYGCYQVLPSKYSRIVMIAQGTGLAPFLSIIQSILSNEEDMSRIILYFCCKRMNEILFRDELYEFSSYWNFSYKIFLSSTIESHNNFKYNEPIMNTKFSIHELEYLKPHSSDQYLICGSEEFMKEYEAFLKKLINSDNIILF